MIISNHTPAWHLKHSVFFFAEILSRREKPWCDVITCQLGHLWSYPTILYREKLVPRMQLAHVHVTNNRKPL